MRSATAYACSASARPTPSGFSQSTCLPASIRATAYGTCEAFGVQMCTISASPAATSSMSAYACSTPQAFATARDRSGLEAITPTTVAPASRAARRCTSPIIPAPRIATLFDAEDPMKVSVEPAAGGAAQGKNGPVTAARILFVEDSDAIRLPVVTALTAHGFVVDAAADGQRPGSSGCAGSRPTW